MFIHPFDHPDIMAGQGTLGLEIVEQCPQVRTVVVPAGGGGLVAGVTVAVKSLDPGMRVVGVQAEAVAAVPGLAGGRAAAGGAARPTMADGIAVGCPGDIPFEHPGRRRGGWSRSRREPVPGAGAVPGTGQAGGRTGRGGRGGRRARARARLRPPVVVVLSGGNIDPLLLSKLLRHGLSAAGRYLAFRCRLPDRPGSLAKLLGDLADLGANVLEVGHERLAPRLHVNEVEVVLQVETRGPEHCGEVIAALRDAGYSLAFA